MTSRDFEACMLLCFIFVSRFILELVKIVVLKIKLNRGL